MIKIAVFDLDGTLVNSLTDLAQSVNKGLVKAGLDEKPVENFNRYVGNGREVMVKRAMGKFADNEELLTIVRDTFNAEYKIHCNDNTTSYEGCAELLEKLRKDGIITAVLSNKPDEFVGKILKKVYPNHTFEEAWGKKPEYKTKPDKQALIAMLDKHNIKPEECIYIGDSDVDVQTAQNSGVKMAGVEWGFRGREELISVGAPFVAKTAEELYDYISGCNE
ncbi:MAG: HAD family hydrolase [Ruminococcus sp.]|nr:HAD family hydrolase [Ruminococcus sp.]